MSRNSKSLCEGDVGRVASAEEEGREAGRQEEGSHPSRTQGPLVPQDRTFEISCLD